MEFHYKLTLNAKYPSNPYRIKNKQAVDYEMTNGKLFGDFTAVEQRQGRY